MKNHNSAGYYSLTGMAPPSDDQRLRDSRELFPAYGSIVDRFCPAPVGVPGFVAFPHQIADGSITPGQHGSFLGKVHDPLFIGLDPAQPGFRLPELSLPEGVDPARLARRETARALVEAQLGQLDKAPLARGLAEQHGKALALLGSAKVRDAFDLSRESESVRDRYGRTTYGQSCWRDVWRKLDADGFRSISTAVLAVPREVGIPMVSAASRCIQSSRTIFCP